MRALVVLLGAQALLAFVLVDAQAQGCPPPPFTRDDLIALRTQRFAVDDGRRAVLALALLPCLGHRDPALRDDVAASAISTWLRGRELAPDVVRSLAARTLAMLSAPRDPAGFAQSFAALTLSEIVRGDRLDSAISPVSLIAITRAARQHMTGIRDYRGYADSEGWRHDVAHTADLILQLGVHPRVDPATVGRLMEALATQVGAHDGHLYLEGEPERLARAVVFTFGRRVLSGAFWESWLHTLASPAPTGDWGHAMRTAEGRARRHNILAFLHFLSFAARHASPAHDDLVALIDDQLRRLIAA